MRKLREVIRLRLACGLSGRAIAQSCRLSVSTVSGYLGRIAVAKLGWYQRGLHRTRRALRLNTLVLEPVVFEHPARRLRELRDDATHRHGVVLVDLAAVDHADPPAARLRRRG